MRVVLDTNVVLDWLVFQRVGASGIQRALEVGQIIVLTSAVALEELQRVLAYPQLKLDTQRQAEAFAQYVAQTRAAELPVEYSRNNLLLPDNFPLCRDSGDQHFLALTYHAKADALVTKDRDLLKMRKRVSRFGVRILDTAQITVHSGV